MRWLALGQMVDGNWNFSKNEFFFCFIFRILKFYAMLGLYNLWRKNLSDIFVIIQRIWIFIIASFDNTSTSLAISFYSCFLKAQALSDHLINSVKIFKTDIRKKRAEFFLGVLFGLWLQSSGKEQISHQGYSYQLLHETLCIL